MIEYALFSFLLPVIKLRLLETLDIGFGKSARTQRVLNLSPSFPFVFFHRVTSLLVLSNNNEMIIYIIIKLRMVNLQKGVGNIFLVP